MKTVSQRFIEFYNYLKSEKIIRSGAELASQLDISPSMITEIKKERSSVGVDTIQRLAEKYSILDIGWLITGRGNMLVPPTVTDDTSTLTGSNEPIAHAVESDSVRKSVRIPSGIEQKTPQKTPIYNLGTPQVVTVDTSGEENIAHVPVKARAGYLSGYGDPEYIESLPTYKLPGLNGGTYRSFEVSGPSMSPTLRNRDWVVGEWVESLYDIRDGRVYIIVTRTEGIVVKRLLNRLSERNTLYLKSDTIDHKNEYPTIPLDPEDVLEIWYARLKFSHDFSEPASIYNRLDNLEIDLMEIKKLLGR